MALKNIKHFDHDHTLHVVKETIKGLVIDDRKTNIISEAFGVKEDLFDKTTKLLIKYSDFLGAQEALALDEDAPEHTKLSRFVAFLKSPQFALSGYKMKEPNDYFVLGFIFATYIYNERQKAMQEGEVTIGGDNLEEIPEPVRKKILEELKKRLK